MSGHTPGKLYLGADAARYCIRGWSGSCCPARPRPSGGDGSPHRGSLYRGGAQVPAGAAQRLRCGPGWLPGDFGIQPTFPATGYGYIQRGEPIGVYGGLDAYHVLRFKEKPDEQQARQLLATGDHVWNSGMFVWRVDRILAEFERQMPALHSGLEEIARAWLGPEHRTVIAKVWPSLKAETIDYGIMEGADRVAVIPAADWKWSDVGSWESLFEVLPTDAQGNIVMGGKHIGLDTAHSLVYVTEERRLIVTIGVSDLVLVDTGDVLLVCHKDQAQRVRQVVDKLKETNQDYL
jgi:mannose-1-phosphate guanylyltransferase